MPDPSAPRIENAIQLAAQAHKGMTDKAGEPYIFHVLRVMLRMETEEERMIAVLHDLVEDTDCRLDDLRRMGYPERIVEAIDSLTKREEETDDYDRFIGRVKTNPLATRVKIADLEDNMNIHRLPELTEEDLKRVRKYHRGVRELSKKI
jgi:(p)ppGpp synthase/HD superfamily hydrolase